MQQAARARPSGGFNPGMGNSFSEHLDENAMQQAVQQKALSQQNANAATAAPAVAQQKAQQQPNKPTPDLGTIPEEVIIRPIKGVVEGLVDQFFSINNWLGIEPVKDDPEKQAKQQQMVQRYNKLNAEEQQVFKKRYQEEMQRKKLEEDEKLRQKQAEEQKKAQPRVTPSSPQKGPPQHGSGKQSAVQKLQQDRKTLGGPGSAN